MVPIQLKTVNITVVASWPLPTSMEIFLQKTRTSSRYLCLWPLWFMGSSPRTSNAKGLVLRFKKCKRVWNKEVPNSFYNLTLFCNGCFPQRCGRKWRYLSENFHRAVTSVEATSHFTSSIEAWDSLARFVDDMGLWSILRPPWCGEQLVLQCVA